jgi:hypothetical protein
MSDLGEPAISSPPEKERGMGFPLKILAAIGLWLAAGTSMTLPRSS